jgi:hypothetical protein
VCSVGHTRVTEIRSRSHSGFETTLDATRQRVGKNARLSSTFSLSSSSRVRNYPTTYMTVPDDATNTTYENLKSKNLDRVEENGLKYLDGLNMSNKMYQYLNADANQCDKRPTTSVIHPPPPAFLVILCRGPFIKLPPSQSIPL